VTRGDKMTKFILHGGFARKDNELNHAFYKECVHDITNGANVLIVPFARQEGYTLESFTEQVDLFKAQAQNKNLNFILATEEKFPSQIKESNVIYLGGGSTRKLLSTLQKYPNIKTLMGGKTIAGSSAGAYVLVTFGASHSEEVVREGLGLVPIRLICHYESLDEPPNALSVSMLKNTAPDLELLFLRDFEWKVFTY